MLDGYGMSILLSLRTRGIPNMATKHYHTIFYEISRLSRTSVSRKILIDRSHCCNRRIVCGMLTPLPILRGNAKYGHPARLQYFQNLQSDMIAPQQYSSHRFHPALQHFSIEAVSQTSPRHLHPSVPKCRFRFAGTFSLAVFRAKLRVKLERPSPQNSWPSFVRTSCTTTTPWTRY